MKNETEQQLYQYDKSWLRRKIVPSFKTVDEAYEAKGNGPCKTSQQELDGFMKFVFNTNQLDNDSYIYYQGESSAYLSGSQYFMDLVKTEAQKVKVRTGSFFDENLSKDFLIIIRDVEFSNLKCLSVGYCQIESIECLPQLNLSALEQLVLKNNCIHSLKPLRKMQNARNLTQFSANENFIVDFQPLIETNFVVLQTLRVGYQFHKQYLSQQLALQSGGCCPDFKCLVKVQSKVLYSCLCEAYEKMKFIGNRINLVEGNVFERRGFQ